MNQDAAQPLSQTTNYQLVTPSHDASRNKPGKRRRLAIWLFCIASTVVLFFVIDFRALIDTVLGAGYEPSSEMSSLITRISLTKTGERILRASRPELESSQAFSHHCPDISAKTSTLGCYSSFRIYVFDVQNSDLDGIREVVLAHELLHAAWQRLDGATKARLQPLLSEVYQSNKSQLSSHMEHYDADDHADELHSVIGTQLSLDNMPTALRDHYANYFSDLASIISLYNQYNGRFVALQTRAEKLSTEIAAKKTEIDTRTADYKRDYEQLNADIEEFNQRAGGGFFSNQSSFTAERNRLLSRQQKLADDYDALSQLVDEANHLVAEYNKNVILQKELYESIDSSEEAVPAPTPSLGT